MATISLPDNGGRLLTLPEAASVLAISKRSLERLISAGEFPKPLKIGRSTRVAKRDIDDFIEGLRENDGGAGQ